MTEKTALIEMTADIVAAYASNGSLSVADLPVLIRRVHTALSSAASGTPEPEAAPITPAVAIKKSITPDFLICLEDGRELKTMKRHLRNAFNLTPEQYRAKWCLPSDYPMVAPNYSAARSAMAKRMGLGQGGRKRPPAPSKAPAKTSGRQKAK